MGYLHIPNLYKDQSILAHAECYALEKVHGTSAHIRWDGERVTLFSGGEKPERFAALFDLDALAEKFRARGGDDGEFRKVVVYGEAYGGKQQGMSHTYGQDLRFIAFDVLLGDEASASGHRTGWVTVPRMEEWCTYLGLEAVPWRQIPCTLAALDAERDRPSEVAIRRGIPEPRPREGIVIRPLIEGTTGHGERLIAKHKGDAFRETAKPRAVVDPAQAKVLTDAEAIAQEWVTPMRLEHVLQKTPGTGPEDTRAVIDAMLADVLREGTGEIVDSPAARRAISQRAARLFAEHYKAALAARA